MLLPWINVDDQYMFYITVTHLLPTARIAIRQISKETESDEQIQGFKILVSQKDVNWAVAAILLSTE